VRILRFIGRFTQAQLSTSPCAAASVLIVRGKFNLVDSKKSELYTSRRPKGCQYFNSSGTARGIESVVLHLVGADAHSQREGFA